MNGRVWLLLKILLVVGLLSLLAHNGLISGASLQHAVDRPEALVRGLFAVGLSGLLGAFRWGALLGAHGIKPGMRQILRLSYVGYFFNLALPGAVSGDLVKVVDLQRHYPKQRASVLGTIVFDRIVGLSALMWLAAGVLLVAPNARYHLPGVIVYSTFLLALFMVVMYVYLFAFTSIHSSLERKLALLPPKVGSSVIRFHQALTHYQSQARILIGTLILSTGMHALVVLGCQQFAEALSGSTPPFAAGGVAVPLGLLVTALPLAPGGIGTGNVAFAYLYGILGYPLGGDIYTLFALASMAFGSIGGLLVLQSRR